MVKNEDFVHLHVHSDYSLLDGAITVPRLVQAAHDFGMRAVALTDHGNMFGAIHFYQEAVAAGIKPIVGYEAYVAPGSRLDRSARSMGEASYHLTLLARNEKGYHNLLRLATTAYLDGFYYRPRIDKEVLAEHVHGLLGMSGCLGGEIATLLLADRYDEAAKVAGFYRDLFGKDGFYLELQDHGMPEQKKVNRELVRLGRELGLDLVATNDSHYLKADDAQAHEVLLCINTGKFLDDEKRMSFESQDHYFKSPQEMAERFRDFPEAVTNTRKVSDLCNLELFFDQKHMPVFTNDEGISNEESFRRLCREGVVERYGQNPPAEVLQRLDYEMGVVERMGFISLFLMTRDVIQFARSQSIPVGPGRGSAAGSVVSYCLGITSVDPMKYGLLFERFLDESRNEAPDFDIDFCQAGRGRIIDYIRGKYGKTEVAQIITFGTLGARAALRDVARVLRIPLDRTDAIAKKVPATLGITLTQALTDEPELARMRQEDPQIGKLFDIALRLEGVCRHASTHAAGVVLADRPLTEYTPLAKVQDEITTQYDMDSLEKAGLVKIDVLGLKTLTVLDRALKEIKLTRGEEVDLSALDLDDPATYAMLSRGESKGVFQMESGGFRDLLVRMKPDRFQDLIALVALYRPGPLGGGLVDSYVERKHGREKFTYDHPVLEEVLKDTYGVMVYQEQVMRIISRLGGIPLARAYTAVKAISKKKAEVIGAVQTDFVAGAVRNGLEESKAEEIFEMIRFFAGYGFNQSHSTCYAFIAFQTAYLKSHYPAEFMAALMTLEGANTDKVVDYVEECRRLEIPVLHPDVNASESAFRVRDGAIRFGLSAVKGAGDKAIESIVEARRRVGDFKSLFDFCAEVDLRVVNRAVVETLIKCGAFDSLGARRSQLTTVMDAALAAGGRVQADRQAGQSNFFDAFAQPEQNAAGDVSLPDIPEWPENQVLAAEKETLGFYITGHPLARYEELLETFADTTVHELASHADRDFVTLGAMVSQVRFTVARNGRSKGERMAMLTLEDRTGSADAVLFPGDYKRNEAYVKPEAVVVVRGRLNMRRETPSITVQDVIPIHMVREKLTGAVTVRVTHAAEEQGVLEKLREVCLAHPGSTEVYLELCDSDGHTVMIRADRALWVTPGESFVEAARKLVGKEHVVLHALPAANEASNRGGDTWHRN